MAVVALCVLALHFIQNSKDYSFQMRGTFCMGCHVFWKNKMSDIPSLRGVDSNLAATVGELQPETSKVMLLSPSLLRLEIPPNTSASPPLWDTIRSQPVNVIWSAQPYSLSIHFTPIPSAIEQQAAPMRNSFNAPSSTRDSLVVPLTLRQRQTSHCGTRSKKLAYSFLQTLTTINQSPFPDSPPFQTRDCSDISICDNFLVGACRAGQKCLRHHTPFPYHWQLFCTRTQKWVSFPLDSQMLLEQKYCDSASEKVYVYDGNKKFEVDFASMEPVTEANYSSLRRLATLSTDRHFPSKSAFFWMTPDRDWEEYDEDVSCLLLDGMEKKEPEVYFSIESTKYMVDFTTMTQTNLATLHNIEVQCRPVYRSPESMMPHLRTVIMNPTMHAHFNVDPLMKFNSWYPPVWGPIPEEEFRLIEVPTGTLAHQSVRNFFHQSLAETKVCVVSIHQVQNLLHWDKYQRCNVHMQKHHKSKEPLERHLFHGTDKAAAKGICQNNFDPRKFKDNTYDFGNGSYFSLTASQSHEFTGPPVYTRLRHMFLAKVLVGRAAVGHKLYYHPPKLGPTEKHHYFDSCVNDEKKPTVFVVFNSSQCYPYYLIKYKNKNKTKNVP